MHRDKEPRQLTGEGTMVARWERGRWSMHEGRGDGSLVEDGTVGAASTGEGQIDRGQVKGRRYPSAGWDGAASTGEGPTDGTLTGFVGTMGDLCVRGRCSVNGGRTD